MKFSGMIKRFFTGIVLTLVLSVAHAQIVRVIVITALELELEKDITPEHGFLPGKKFTFYPTINKYDFGGKKFRLELYDQRDSLHLEHPACSGMEINNKSEFAGQEGTQVVVTYFQRLFPQAGILLDSAATDTLKVYLEALDSRLIGFGYITPHGLCQLRVQCAAIVKSYCVDITDKDPHSPISKNAFVTRKTATRVIQSAAVREAIEQFFIDLQAVK
jgi:hypothetical protein